MNTVLIATEVNEPKRPKAPDKRKGMRKPKLSALFEERLLRKMEGKSEAEKLKMRKQFDKSKERHAIRLARKMAERTLGEAVDEAVITVPAYFNHAQRSATLEAARMAGLRSMIKGEEGLQASNGFAEGIELCDHARVLRLMRTGAADGKGDEEAEFNDFILQEAGAILSDHIQLKG